ncbi:MAG: SDR family oxidoreductase [Alphaproteobacteria bacterium]|nr:SDR family oxidoreductase [Alphaproteobacteria bacterium]
MADDFTVMITGCDSGLGREFARSYARDGWHVVATYRDHANRIPDAEGGDRMSHAQLDVTQFRQFEALKQHFGGRPIDILISNAGIGLDWRKFGDVDYDYFRRMFEVNTVGPMKLAETFVDNVAASRLKRIAIVSSRMGSIGCNLTGGHYGYRASKAGVNAVLRSLAVDLVPRGVRVVGLHPGWARTAEPEAPVAVEESVEGMRRIIARLSAHDTGQFYNYDGAPLPW